MSEPLCHTVKMQASAIIAFGLVMIFDLENLFSNSNSWWIFVASFIEIPPLSTEILLNTKHVLTDIQQRDGKTDSIHTEHIATIDDSLAEASQLTTVMSNRRLGHSW